VFCATSERDDRSFTVVLMGVFERATGGEFFLEPLRQSRAFGVVNRNWCAKPCQLSESDRGPARGGFGSAGEGVEFVDDNLYQDASLRGQQG
jgi:hypothetical protein